MKLKEGYPVAPLLNMNIILDSFIDTLEAISNIHEFDNEHGTRTAMIAAAKRR